MVDVGSWVRAHTRSTAEAMRVSRWIGLALIMLLYTLLVFTH